MPPDETHSWSYVFCYKHSLKHTNLLTAVPLLCFVFSFAGMYLQLLQLCAFSFKEELSVPVCTFLSHNGRKQIWPGDSSHQKCCLSENVKPGAWEASVDFCQQWCDVAKGLWCAAQPWWRCSYSWVMGRQKHSLLIGEIFKQSFSVHKHVCTAENKGRFAKTEQTVFCYTKGQKGLREAGKHCSVNTKNNGMLSCMKKGDTKKYIYIFYRAMPS